MRNLSSIAALKQIKILTILMLCWLLYSLLYIYFKEDAHSVVSGLFALIGEAGLDLVVVALSYAAWKHTDDATKIFFLFLTIAFIAAFLSDSIYNYLLNIERVKISTFVDSLFDIPFAVFLLLYMLAWCSMFMKMGNSKTGKSVNYLPYILASIIIFVAFVFGISWKVKYSSVIGVYQIIDTLFEAIGFLFASFCFVLAKKLWIKYISVGYLIVIGSDFIIRYSVVKNNIITINPLETTWVLGLSLVILGFFFSKERIKMEAAC